MKRKGIILAGGSGSRLFPLTIAVSKQLMPVYDKPMIYYPLSVLMLAGIQDVLIIATPMDSQLFERLFGDGSDIGMSISYAEQAHPDGLAQAFHIGADFLNGSPSALILGDNLFYGHDFVTDLKIAAEQKSGAAIFGYHVADPSAYGVVQISADGRPIAIEEKPIVPQSNYAIPGLYFYDETAVDKAKTLKPSARGELEITDLNRLYLNEGSLRVQILGRGTAWLDTGEHDSLLDAAEFVRIIEKRQGLKIACVEEIALRHGWINLKQLETRIERLGRSSYRQYLELLVSSKSEATR